MGLHFGEGVTGLDVRNETERKKARMILGVFKGLSKYIYVYRYMYECIYVYVSACLCVCVCV